MIQYNAPRKKKIHRETDIYATITKLERRPGYDVSVFSPGKETEVDMYFRLTLRGARRVAERRVRKLRKNHFTMPKKVYRSEIIS